MGKPIAKLKGNIYGKLTVIDFSHTNKGHSYWKCKCSCGNDCIRSITSLKGNHVRSCGCLVTERMQKLNREKRLPPGTSGARAIHGAYKCHAKKQGIIFELSIFEFETISLKNCYYCGAIPSNVNKEKYNLKKFIYNGLDKKNPNEGYTLSNCLPCCKMCNWSKGKKSYQEFINYLDNLVNYRSNLKKCD